MRNRGGNRIMVTDVEKYLINVDTHSRKTSRHAAQKEFSHLQNLQSRDAHFLPRGQDTRVTATPATRSRRSHEAAPRRSPTSAGEPSTLRVFSSANS